ncbi:ABC transporter permease [Clostridium thermosuccinogenes]|uniref:ABC transporter permease n=1 Tax=Clostridium thermosuccinogenes TaxID=84032 RepID=A0A2K2F226_9CLOT|nr:sugar ABC transporter permease [Pseudoclostridium thermosuccinogenes]AUS96496.1 ABC transporter permease [Pseudoclostridium thermosuccinogenes]PNT92841.1 ABC transporter permease [Pseudoclostridium thermosuccinogenes]PNT94547.1 ABC transporter permease [Pseudoclostridium thermosuccinogenes]PNT94994.1 ABC transporter permease [Pseudoclostridium thermosuccinogenes]
MLKGKKRSFWIVMFLAPSLVLFFMFYGIPLGMVFSTSFFNWKLSTPKMSFAGFSNYMQLLSDSSYRTAFRNTLIWIAIQSTVHVSIGTLVALTLAKHPKGWKFVRTSYMIPNIISSAAFAMIFLNIFNAEYGVVNNFIRLLGFEDFNLNWYFDSRSAFFTVTLSWVIYAPVIMLLILAEISSIDQSILEAAKVDGASSFQTDIYIVLPLLRNAIGSSVVVAGTSMLKEFEHIYLTTKGGPGTTTLNLPLYLYNTAMKVNNYSYANAVGVTIIIIGVIFVISINRLFRVGHSDI